MAAPTTRICAGKVIPRRLLPIVVVAMILPKSHLLGEEVFGITHVTPPGVACQTVFQQLVGLKSRNTDEALGWLESVQGKGKMPGHSRHAFPPYFTAPQEAFVARYFRPDGTGAKAFHEHRFDREQGEPVTFLIEDNDPVNSSQNWAGGKREFPDQFARFEVAKRQIQRNEGVALGIRHNALVSLFFREIHRSIKEKIPLAEAVREEWMHRGARTDGYMAQPSFRGPMRVARLLPEYTFDFFTHLEPRLFRPIGVLGIPGNESLNLLMLKFPLSLGVYVWRSPSLPETHSAQNQFEVQVRFPEGPTKSGSLIQKRTMWGREHWVLEVPGFRQVPLRKDLSQKMQEISDRKKAGALLITDQFVGEKSSDKSLEAIPWFVDVERTGEVTGISLDLGLRAIIESDLLDLSFE